jgi:hypothetical protein
MTATLSQINQVISTLQINRCRCGSTVIDASSRPVARLCSTCRSARVFQAIRARGATKVTDLARSMLVSDP